MCLPKSVIELKFYVPFPYCCAFGFLFASDIDFSFGTTIVSCYFIVIFYFYFSAIFMPVVLRHCSLGGPTLGYDVSFLFAFAWRLVSFKIVFFNSLAVSVYFY